MGPMQNLEAGIAPLWLGPGSEHCSVIGGSGAENVLDQGSENSVRGAAPSRGVGESPLQSEPLQGRLSRVRRPWLPRKRTRPGMKNFMPSDRLA